MRVAAYVYASVAIYASIAWAATLDPTTITAFLGG